MSSESHSINSIKQILDEIYERHRHNYTGEIADYIPELTRANPDWFGIAITTVDGRQYLAGDTTVEYSIQSVSKPFIYGLALDAIGARAVREKIDVEPSGEAFNSISLKPGTGQPKNPMINAGAIAATGLIKEDSGKERFNIILEKFGDFAGKPLELDESVYRSESETGFRNRAIGNLMRNFNILEGDVDPVLEAYFKQCAILVDSRSLSVMGATLANRGVNPLTRKRVLTEATVEKVISVMSTCGMYDFSGNWAFEVGIPAKSGVGGGIVGVLPGQLSVAVFSPLLDQNFNSVRGIETFRDLSRTLGLHLFNRPTLTDYVIRRTYTLADFKSTQFRPESSRKVLEREGHRGRIFELQGDLYFGAFERLMHLFLKHMHDTDRALIDLTRIGSIDEATRKLVFRFAKRAFEKGKRIVIVDPGGIFSPEERKSLVPMTFVYDNCDEALEDAEENILAQYGGATRVSHATSFKDMDLLKGLDKVALSALEKLCHKQIFEASQTIIKKGSAPAEMYFLSRGIVNVHLNTGEETSAQKVSSFSPGMSFGESALFAGDVRSADVCAQGEVEVFTLKTEAMSEFLDTYPRAFAKILQNALVAYSERLVRANREVSALK